MKRLLWFLTIIFFCFDLPATTLKVDRAVKSLAVKDVSFLSPKLEGSKESITLQGNLVKRNNAKYNVLICHGYMIDYEQVSFLRHIFPEANILTFGFRGHSKQNKDQVCSIGKHESLDVAAAVKYFKSIPEFKGKPLFVYAFSMGAVASILAQHKDPTLFDAMVLDCPYDTAYNVVARGLDDTRFKLFGYEFGIPGKNLLKKLAFNRFTQPIVQYVLIAGGRTVKTHMECVDTVEAAKKISVPTFYISCKNDGKVPPVAIKNIYENTASSFKRLWITEGRHHFDSYFHSPEKYTYNVRKFVNNVVSRKFDKKEIGKIKED
ncbi:MAG: hypothetical protein UR26_C0004G0005 [candidate division TM6 bacterium GW2011_GWF2_32_72]|nr:MAG: hypothetical protein UR26_C0004G0005 [candidate division TM6 bacterium GW2011_GWF2_32_72]